MKAIHHDILMNPVLSKELVDLGRYLRVLRLKQKMTIADMCTRVSANPRTVAKIEKGDPSVSLGVFIKYLSILGLSHDLSIRILGDYIYAVSERKRESRVFSDDEMNF